MKAQLRNPKVLAGAGLLALLLLVALWPVAETVSVSQAVRGPLRVTVEEEGETRCRDRFVVSAPVAGRVLRIELEPGDAVRRGETVVATFLPGDPAPLDARSRAEARAGVAAADSALGRARAEHELAEKAVELTRSELARHRSLAAQQIVSGQMLEAKETEAKQAEDAQRAASFAVATAEHRREVAKARLLHASGRAGGQPLEIRSPIDGVVLRRLRESEAVVPTGEPLLELGDPRDIEIVADLLSTDAVKVEPGDPVWIEQWGGDDRLEGRVRRVEPSGFMKISALGVEEQRVNVVIDFQTPAAARQLGDGYRVEVQVVVWKGDDVLKLPTSSLFRHGDSWSVFALEGGRARLREVEVGRRNGLEAQVLSGIEAGARVVVHPSDAIADGTRVAEQTS